MIEQPGALADVLEARRALLAVVQPWWARALPYLGLVFMVVSLSMSPLLGAAFGLGWMLLIILAGGAALLVTVTVLARRLRVTRPVRPFWLQLWSRRVSVVQWALFAVLLVPMLALVVAAFYLDLPAWTYSAGMLALVVAFVPTLSALAWRIDPYGVDSAPLRDLPDGPNGPDGPAAPDAVIGPRQSLMACAALASTGQLGSDLLAGVLGVTEQELGQRTAGLVGAQYLYLQPDRTRWWFGLTPAGRTAYRRHLRVLLSQRRAA